MQYNIYIREIKSASSMTVPFYPSNLKAKSVLLSSKFGTVVVH